MWMLGYAWDDISVSKNVGRTKRRERRRMADDDALFLSTHCHKGVRVTKILSLVPQFS